MWGFLVTCPFFLHTLFTFPGFSIRPAPGVLQSIHRKYNLLLLMAQCHRAAINYIINQFTKCFINNFRVGIFFYHFSPGSEALNIGFPRVSTIALQITLSGIRSPIVSFLLFKILGTSLLAGRIKV